MGGLKFSDIPNGLAAFSKVPALGWAQIAAYMGFVELSGGFDDYRTGTPGDYGWKALTSSDPAERTKKLQAELANGRLAMIAIIAMFVQNGITGTTGPLMWMGQEPTGRAFAFENELGVQSPVGFYDPVGFTADGDVAAFRRRRSVELKHGRISMLACMGYMTPEITGKFPGYLSPSMDLKFSDIPNGLGALSKVPGVGWAQIFLYCAYCELSQDQTAGAGADQNFGFKAITSSDPATLTKKLNAEIANGRLAMMAIIGMFFQDGLTGSAWGDWANYVESPLRAFENELGVQPPVGFWDPLEFTKDGNSENFLRRRAVEI